MNLELHTIYNDMINKKKEFDKICWEVFEKSTENFETTKEYWEHFETMREYFETTGKEKFNDMLEAAETVAEHIMEYSADKLNSTKQLSNAYYITNEILELDDKIRTFEMETVIKFVEQIKQIG